MDIGQVAIDRGKQILPVRWVDVNKGDKQKLKLRSCIVGKEFKAKTREALLACTPFGNPAMGDDQEFVLPPGDRSEG